MANNFNICENWGLRCYEQKMTEKSVILKCSMNRKGDDGEYTAPIYIDVVCSIVGDNQCDIARDDYAKSFVDVWGRFSVGDYTNKNGDKIPTMTIFATKVAKRVRNN